MGASSSASTVGVATSTTFLAVVVVFLGAIVVAIIANKYYVPCAHNVKVSPDLGMVIHNQGNVEKKKINENDWTQV